MNYLTTLTDDSCEKLERLLIHNEQYRKFPYDDATGLLVTAPKGNITWLIGANVTAGGDLGLAQVVMRYTLTQLEVELKNATTGFLGLSEVRKIVLFDMAFTLGVPRLMTFGKMWLAIDHEDWHDAAAEILSSVWHKAEAPHRAEVDADMMLTDAWCGL